MEQQVNIYQQRAAGALACTCLPRKMWPSDKSCVRVTRPKLSPSHRVHPHTTRARAATRSQSFYLRLGCCSVRESRVSHSYSILRQAVSFFLPSFVSDDSRRFFTRLIRRSSRRARDWFIWCWRPPEHLCRAYYCILKTTQAKQMICSFGVTRDRSSDDLSKTPQGGDRGPFFFAWLVDMTNLNDTPQNKHCERQITLSLQRESFETLMYHSHLLAIFVSLNNSWTSKLFIHKDRAANEIACLMNWMFMAEP